MHLASADPTAHRRSPQGAPTSMPQAGRMGAPGRTLHVGSACGLTAPWFGRPAMPRDRNDRTSTGPRRGSGGTLDQWDLPQFAACHEGPDSKRRSGTLSSSTPRSPDHVGSAQSDRTRPGPVKARSDCRRARPRHPWAASPEESKAMTPSSRGSLRKMRRSWR